MLYLLQVPHDLFSANLLHLGFVFFLAVTTTGSFEHDRQKLLHMFGREPPHSKTLWDPSWMDTWNKSSKSILKCHPVCHITRPLLAFMYLIIYIIYNLLNFAATSSRNKSPAYWLRWPPDRCDGPDTRSRWKHTHWLKVKSISNILASGAVQGLAGGLKAVYAPCWLVKVPPTVSILNHRLKTWMENVYYCAK